MPIAQHKPVFKDAPEWPGAKPAVAAAGHNNPPVEEVVARSLPPHECP